jgi:signal transduction histidine kinase
VENAVQCLKKGAYDFITKPFHIDHLRLCVKRSLEKQALERQARRLQEEQARNLYTLAMEQSRLLTIVNCMADGVLVTNRNLEVVLCNPSFSQFLGLTSPCPLPAPLESYFNHQTFQETLHTLLHDTGLAAGKFLSQEFSLDRRHCRCLSAPFYGPDQEVLGTVSVFHDITALKELDEMKTSFVNMVSHELRSPLGAIKMQLQVILDGLAGEVTEKQQEMLSRANGKIQGLIDLITDLLDVAKIEAGHQHLEQVPLNLAEILGGIFNLLQAKAAGQKVSLHLEAPPDLPLIRADRRGMEEVFTNLVSNAINYSPDGGEVLVKLVPQPDYLEVRVSDTGVGIDPEEIGKIFDKFYRVKNPRTRQVIGTGLGLAIVKGVIDAHRGSVSVESRLGAGTTFKVRLPAASSPGSPDDRHT